MLARTQVRFGRYAVFRKACFPTLRVGIHTGNSIASAEKNIFGEYFIRII